MLDAVDHFIETRVAPAARAIDADADFFPDLLTGAAALGLQGLVHDGAGSLDVSRMDLAREVTERISVHSPAVALGVAGARLSAYLLAKYAPAHLRERWVASTLAARTYGSFAITEPDAGTDVRALSTVAIPDGDHYLLSGHKCWVGFAPVADVAIVLAKVGTTNRDAPMVALVVDMASPGASGRPGPALSGFRGMPNGELHFDAVRVPRGDRLDVEGFAGMMDGLNMARIDAAAYACGLLRGSLLVSLARANARQAFGRSIGDLQVIQRKLGRMAADYRAARELTRRAAESFALGGGGDQDVVSMAKMFASDAARRHTDEAMQIHGALGVVADEDVNRMHRDAKVTQIFDGTSEIHETMLGRRALRMLARGEPLTAFLGSDTLEEARV
ncbi:acyl-CoA dehydrogenase family protein [Jiangella mangrovi]|uniref:Alkylation response protein AidB-like acyl-CoA dehydrogenase n=1 Tax=Jiangella mangrovi TaxID=1524084 RepID=A0A7W9GWZ0_9ACTN|nr:acyl-CoA dehydrogenase [Jiangella mangrovi]MBB5791304.1 alkylation response protein AidB-like acyl-CoA dehydrogenase [Jiangella mangrovi]